MASPANQGPMALPVVAVYLQSTPTPSDNVNNFHLVFPEKVETLSIFTNERNHADGWLRPMSQNLKYG